MIPAPWLIDNRSTYDRDAGLNAKPLQLGAVIAECPTAFGGHTVRAPATIGKPCPTKEALDALGLAHATAIAALPDLIEAAREALGTFKRQLRSEESIGTPLCGDDEHEAIRLLTAALAKARPA